MSIHMLYCLPQLHSHIEATKTTQTVYYPASSRWQNPRWTRLSFFLSWMHRRMNDGRLACQSNDQ